MKRLCLFAALVFCFPSFLMGQASSQNAASNASRITGIWVLHQVESVASLQRTAPEIEKALSDFDTVGFCLRYPWKAADQDLTLLAEAKKIADKHNKQFCIRFMAGRHTPQRLFDAGCPYYVVNTMGKAEKVPAPMTADGKPNAIFEKEYDAYVSRLAQWCRSNNVHLLHLAWYGQDWAELNNGVQVRSLPGYSYDAWYKAHTNLMDIALKYASDDLTVEFPFSGYGPTGDTTAQFADYVWNQNGPNNDTFIFQANGWAPNGVFGSPDEAMEKMKAEAFSRPVLRALQMIQPQDYDWKAVFAHLYKRNATYGEIYTPSFAMEHANDLKAEIAKFAQYCREKQGPRPPASSEQKPPRDVMNPQLSNADAVKGTWALRQASSIDELQRSMPEIEKALKTPGLRGFSLRCQWKNLQNNNQYDFSLLEEGLRIARAHNLDFSVRFMAGRHSPEDVFAAGSPYYLSGQEKIPTPFYEDGSPNVIFEQQYDKFVAHLASWCRANNVRLLHLAWYGQAWAELNNGKEVRAQKGYSEKAFVNAHKRLIEIGLRYSGKPLAVEFPFSGYGPLVGISSRFADFVINQIGPSNPIFFCQANGWGERKDWGGPDDVEVEQDKIWLKPICRGEQMIQPQDYDWQAVYKLLYQNKATYCEVYTPSFGLKRAPQLAEQIQLFKDFCDKQTPLPPTDTTNVNQNEKKTTLATTMPASMPAIAKNRPAPASNAMRAASAPASRRGNAPGMRPWQRRRPSAATSRASEPATP